MAARSVKVNVVNNSKYIFYHNSDGLNHGVWVTYQGPYSTGPFQFAKEIDADGGTGYFASESDGVMTGTQGWAAFQDMAGQQITFHWDNPWDGANSYSAPCFSGVKVSHTSGHGDNAEVTFTIENA